MFQLYETKKRFAVRFNKDGDGSGNVHGWPSEIVVLEDYRPEVPEVPAIPEVVAREGKPARKKDPTKGILEDEPEILEILGQPAVPGVPGVPAQRREDMAEKLKTMGYTKEATAEFVELKGEDLNRLRGELWPEQEKIEKAREDERRKELERLEIDAATKRAIGEGFEFKGERFSLSDAAQANLQRWMTLYSIKVLKFPLEVSTADGDTAKISEKDFPGFLETANGAIASALKAGREAKAALG